MAAEAATDDLTRPLGGVPASARRWRIRLPLAKILSATMLATGAGLAFYIALFDDPLGGEPHALVPVVARPAAAPEASTSLSRVQEVPADGPRRTAAEVERASGVSVMRGDGAGAPSSVVIRVPDGPAAAPGSFTPLTPVASGLAPAPDATLLERGRHGSLPRIGPDGRRPFDVYRRPVVGLPNGAPPAGRIALVVGGLGISPTATADAIKRLPEAVTLAFAPYGSDLDRVAARARESGHEIMLQVPMEPFDYPDNDPGPHTMTTKAKAAENLDRLHWAMSRFPGYVGLVNFMGAKLTADEAALAPILREIGSRGLAFVDDGSSSRSLAAKVGKGVQTPVARADLVIDGVPRADAIDRELARLEELARSQGIAVGTASALPLSLDRIAQWSRTLESRGILLIPASGALDGAGSR